MVFIVDNEIVKILSFNESKMSLQCFRNGYLKQGNALIHPRLRSVNVFIVGAP